MAKRHAGGRSKRACESAGTLADLVARFPDEESCERELLRRAYPAGFVCPRCGCATCSPVAGRAHKWQCTRCRRQFSVTRGTAMENTHLPLTKWFVAVWLVANDKRGVSASELQAYVGCGYRAASRMLARIRRAMARSECLQRAVR